SQSRPSCERSSSSSTQGSGTTENIRVDDDRGFVINLRPAHAGLLLFDGSDRSPASLGAFVQTRFSRPSEIWPRNPAGGVSTLAADGTTKNPPSGGLSVMTKQAHISFVMVGLVPTICKPLICIDPRHKAEDDDGEASGLQTA
ncbi:MAG: hypothetical protein ACK4K8_15995, partial [Pannonibacter sp.]